MTGLTKTRIALLQMTSGIDPEANFESIAQAARTAAGKGAKALFTPEMALLLDKDRKRAARWVESDRPQHLAVQLGDLAREYAIDIALGSMPVAAQDGLWANRSYYFSAHSARAVTYDKIHMFDVALESGERWRESAVYRPGEKTATLDHTPLGRLGLAICYDLRFPALFDALGEARCNAIAVPAAFTRPTGKDHWHILVRARAIEASAFVIATAQAGLHEDGRATYGHSLVVDPWGEVLLDMGDDGAGLGYCDLDLARIDAVRTQLPSLANRRKLHIEPLA